LAGPKALTPVEAYEAIQKLLESRDSISFTPHARKRMRERHFNVDDVRRVLMHGTVSGSPAWDETFQNWRYKVTGVDYDNVPLVLIIALEPPLGRLTVITGTDD
jgi:hypothetical protein